jgi:uncharacterized membrane protein
MKKTAQALSMGSVLSIVPYIFYLLCYLIFMATYDLGTGIYSSILQMGRLMVREAE